MALPSWLVTPQRRNSISHLLEHSDEGGYGRTFPYRHYAAYVTLHACLVDFRGLRVSVLGCDPAFSLQKCSVFQLPFGMNSAVPEIVLIGDRIIGEDLSVRGPEATLSSYD
ncbi:hypothetical protein AVEN_202568-1 [Araneus ventricosus]|uniref:Uncharacterized protein n=1 Tax=Araneus ventricosus TaxID=182803 RepID=A0A4Y2K2R7_ARAVE|nr:hypothetical protein AVEN_202568-1 [Araneus ventricosus]